MLAIMLPSHAGDGTATQGCTGCGKVAQPPEIRAMRCCRIVKKSNIRVSLRPSYSKEIS
jgi:hypothetical protein